MHEDPTFLYERTYWEQGITTIAGIDEAGMGALAGPVVAAAVVFSVDEVGIMKQELGQKKQATIRDSKLLSSRQRERLVPHIQSLALAWAIGEASVAEIATLNIRRAAHLAMRRAVEALPQQPELLLIDGTPCQPHPTIPAVTLVNGDALSFSIAAASILAKVHRDTFMIALHERYPVYGFAGHKGYGSATHLAALTEHGASPHHRATYAPVAQVIIKGR